MENKDKPAYAYVVPQGLGSEHSPIESGVVPGLTKREMFAMAAMQGMITALGNHMTLSKDEAEVVASQSIQFADIILNQLES